MAPAAEGLVASLGQALAACIPPSELTFLGFQIGGHYLLEGVLLLLIAFLFLQKSYAADAAPSLTPQARSPCRCAATASIDAAGVLPQEVDQLCSDWTPEPLHPPPDERRKAYEPPVLESSATPWTTIKGRRVLNLASNNFLGLIGHADVEKECTASILKYGVGSCGPRGFYGTIGSYCLMTYYGAYVHLDLEERISQFLGVEDTIIYSYGLATASSTIPAFCKKGDLIIADAGVNFGIVNGLTLSRSTVKYFKHNDMEDLERILKEVRLEDQRKKKVLNRRFIIFEAINQSSGQIAPLKKLVQLKEKYFFRLLVDESLSIGVLGRTGRGISEYFGIPPQKLDIIVAAMGNALASAGGFCCGSAKVADHQRLSGLGYCFSASLPPFLATAAITALSIMDSNPGLRSQLQKNVATFRTGLIGIDGLRVEGDVDAPIVLLNLSRSLGSYALDAEMLQRLADKMLEEESILVVVRKLSKLDLGSLPAGICIAVSAGHTEDAMLQAAAALKRVSQGILR
eukprot:SM000124S25920  [mRNA]  locus=s124:156388:160198:+ [translate_table: standard]